MVFPDFFEHCLHWILILPKEILSDFVDWICFSKMRKEIRCISIVRISGLFVYIISG
ncbi:hypothetical protein LEP1GSC193_2140 [Leptospira alstonii serovar Pingchang str. 80-412]|uniref:Uncharacterized protein n=2 Tax=Leptospira alstonii TaxID=28452 RepID=M6D4K1_9LEPT|nr:hypothetical protein LEP1GSC194_0458 [Leptospira alstonii serovar Sichuan str. 79601]EQA79786.1 hypothetical protein LEP1GSC193_2140 [Leptospira alstonii serovar Pingchang str. 80-412]